MQDFDSLLPCGENKSDTFDTCLGTPPASHWTMSSVRRTLDVFTALFALLVLAMPMAVVAACVRLTSKGNALFSQERVGRNGRLFQIYKFRSMVETRGTEAGPAITKGGDLRVTSLGRWLRKFKLDELPQFYNVLRGDMSLVGPRPKLPQYAGILDMPYRPGITGWATIAFRGEEEILRQVDPQQVDLCYRDQIQPAKARLDVCYMCRATASSDLRIIASTILSCMIPSIVSFHRMLVLSPHQRFSRSLRRAGPMKIK